MDAFHIPLLSPHEDTEVEASYHFANLPEGVMLIMSDGRDCGDASADLGRSKKGKKKEARVPPL